MASFNRVILLGNITRDIELKYTQSSLAVTELGLAVNDRRKNQAGEWVEETTFVDVTLWGRTAEIAGEYLGKGSSVLIEGRLKLDTWEKEGQKRSKLRVVGERMQMLGTRGNGGNRAGSESHDTQSASADSSPVDSLPADSSPVDSSPADSSPADSSPAVAGGPPDDDVPF